MFVIYSMIFLPPTGRRGIEYRTLRGIYFAEFEVDISADTTSQAERSNAGSPLLCLRKKI